MPRLRSFMVWHEGCDESVVHQALLQPSAQRRASMRDEPGTVGGVLSALRRGDQGVRTARRRAEAHRAVGSWNVHGSGIDVASTLASSYRTGTLL